MNTSSKGKAMRGFLLFVLVLCYSAVGCWSAGFRVNVTHSLPLGLYRLSPGAPGKGDYVSFCLEGEYAELAREREYVRPGSCPSGLRPLLKQVAGLPGDMVQVAALCPLAVDSMNRPIASALRDGSIPPGMALVLASHAGSFDSRYFGLVPLASLQRVEPVFIFQHSTKGEIPMHTEASIAAAAQAVMEQLAENQGLMVPVDVEVAEYMGLSEEKAVSADDLTEDGLLTVGPDGAVYYGEE